MRAYGGADGGRGVSPSATRRRSLEELYEECRERIERDADDEEAAIRMGDALIRLNGKIWVYEGGKADEGNKEREKAGEEEGGV